MQASTNLRSHEAESVVPPHVHEEVERLLASIPDGVLKRYREKNDLSLAEAKHHYRELMRFFFAGERGERIVPSLTVDEAWHNFILFTAEYGPWCEENFGHFIHHHPTVEDGADDSSGYEFTAHLMTDVLGGDPNLWPALSVHPCQHGCTCGQGPCQRGVPHAHCGGVPDGCGQSSCTRCGKK